MINSFVTPNYTTNKKNVRTTCGQHNVTVLKCSHSEATAIIEQVIMNP